MRNVRNVKRGKTEGGVCMITSKANKRKRADHDPHVDIALRTLQPQILTHTYTH